MLWAIFMYEMLCGTTPFQSDTDYRLMKDKLEKQPESILRENPTVPDAFEKIIFKALQRNPNRRYPSALEMKNAIEKCLGGELLDQSTLAKVLQASQVFTEPQKGNEIISVNKILSQAKSISGRFKIPTVSKVNWSLVILGVSVLLSAILLIWSGGADVSAIEEIPETPVMVTWEEPADEPLRDVVKQTTGDFKETPSEMYHRIAEQPVEKVKPQEKKTYSKNTTSNTKMKTTINDGLDSKPSDTEPSEREEPSASSENRAEKTTVSNRPADVPAGKSIFVTLMENLSSEELERDGKLVRLICNENVVADDRIIIRKGAAVTGKIVDVIPSSHNRKKALIGFVIQQVEAVDGSTVKLRSKRFQLFSEAPGKPISYRSGETFEVTLKRGTVN